MLKILKLFFFIPSTMTSATTPMQPAKRRFREMSEAEQRDLLASGRRKLRNCTFTGSDFENLYATDCTIRGNNVHVIGNGNWIIGLNNRATGTGNTFSIPEPPAPPPPPASPPRPAAADDANFSFIFDGDANFSFSPASAANAPLLSFIVDAIRAPSARRRRPSRRRAAVVSTTIDASSLPANTTAAPAQPLAQNTFLWLPEAGIDQRNSNWKKSALDLPGEPVVCENEEMRCVVCLEYKREIVFEPCHHVCCCRSCAKELTYIQKDPLLPLKCPECREPVQYMSILFI